jgi:hypothetical protein
MDWENPGRNAPATVLAAAEGVGTNKMEEIEVVGVPIEKVKRKFKRQDLTMQGVFPNVNVIIGSACEPGCKALVRMALDAVWVDGTLNKLKEPITIFVGKQFEPYIKNAEGNIIVYGDCAKGVLPYYPNAQVWGSTPEFPNCTPIWSNQAGIGLADYIRSLV